MKTIFTLFLLSFPLLIHAQNSLSAESKQELVKFIQKEMKKKKVQGVSIALVDDQNTIWEEGFGYADVLKNKAADAQTVYRIGSVSKLFVAFSIMQLHEEGQLDIDQPVQKYLPNFKPKIRPEFASKSSVKDITIRHLLTHQSGLPSDVLDQFFGESPPPFQSIVDYLNEEYVCTPPETIMSYSNPAFSLLGVIVEKVSGQSFLDYTQNLFASMGMEHSSFEMNPNLAPFYSESYDEKGKPYTEGLIRDVPAGMMHSNVKDLSQFMKMILNNGKAEKNRILKKETLEAMLEPQNLEVPLDFEREIGLCFFINHPRWDYAGGNAGHGGDTQVFHAQLTTLPEQNLGVVVLTNSTRGSSVSRTVARKILRKALEDFKGLKAPEQEKDYKKIKLKPTTKDKDQLSKELQALTGDYHVGPMQMTLTEKKGQLATDLLGQNVRFVPNSEGTFTLRLILLGFIPLTQKSTQLSFEEVDGRAVIKMTENERSSLLGSRIEKTPLLDSWKNRLGKYALLKPLATDEKPLFSNFTLLEKDGYIHFQMFAFGEEDEFPMALKIISDTEAIIHGIGRQTGATIQILEKDGKEILRFSGMELVKIEE